MKRMICVLIGAAAVLSLLMVSSSAEAKTRKPKFGQIKDDGPSSRIAFDVRLHDEFPGLADLPVEKNDVSYGLFYEYHEGIGYWQIGADYMPSPGTEGADYIVTPEINLILKDRIYRLGSGAMKSYVKGDDGRHWTSIYWQVIAGFGIPLGDYFSIDIYAHYVFNSWKEFTDTDLNAVDYTAGFTLSF